MQIVLRNRGFLIHSIFVFCFIFIAGCSNTNINTDSTFAGLDRYQVMINDDGTVKVIGDPGPDYDFSGWKDIKSVSVGGPNAAGVKKDGTVYVTGSNRFGVCDTSGWTDIKMVEFTAAKAIGLKSDGTIIHTIGSGSEDVYINNELDKWTDIKQIDASEIAVIGLKNDGTVVAAFYTPEDTQEYTREIQGWKNVKWVSASAHMMIGLTYEGKILFVRDTVFIGDSTEPFIKLSGAVKVCVGKTFVAGLMKDGTVKVRVADLNKYPPDFDFLSGAQERKELYENKQELLSDDFKAINEATDIVDINSYEDVLIALKRDGTILVAGYYD